MEMIRLRIDTGQKNLNLAWLVAMAVLGLSGCGATLQYAQVPQMGVARTPMVEIDQATNTASVEISVLVFNVAGLPWPLACGNTSRDLDENGERIPIACNRAEALKKIGDMLAELRERDSAPDIIMMQEAFISASAEIPERGGYPNWVAGPSASDLGSEVSDRASAEFIAERQFWKGEKLGKRQSSGLVLASNFPILELHNHPFNQWECAGYDCLANKGLLLVRIEIPGVPDPLEVVTTHFNSRGASGVTSDRARDAHNLQVDEADEFLLQATNSDNPEIWGGDLNMRHAGDRIEHFVERAAGGLNEVSSYCLVEENDCEVMLEWGTDTPWYETQDLQGWFSGKRVEVRPIRVEGLFDERVDGKMPSDHNGLLVRYRLTWAIP
jgi:endonuclease/exonuclease/phosphatase family metal-dependent hydrolase